MTCRYLHSPPLFLPPLAVLAVYLAASLSAVTTKMTVVMVIVTGRRHRIMVASRPSQLTTRFPRPPLPKVPMLALLSELLRPLTTSSTFLGQVASRHRMVDGPV